MRRFLVIIVFLFSFGSVSAQKPADKSVAASATADKPKPITSEDTINAQNVLAAEQTARKNKCAEEIKASLAKYGFQLVPTITLIGGEYPRAGLELVPIPR